MSYENLIEELMRCGRYLQLVPGAMKSFEMCMLALNTLKSIPNEMKTLELCKMAVYVNGYALQYVPNEMKTFELCMLAVQNSCISLDFVPDELKNAVRTAFTRPAYRRPRAAKTAAIAAIRAMKL